MKVQGKLDRPENVQEKKKSKQVGWVWEGKDGNLCQK